MASPPPTPLFRLPRFNGSNPLVDKDGRPSVAYMAHIHKSFSAIETAFAAQTATNASLTAQLAAITAAQAAATAAQATATTAQTTANTVTRTDKISASATVPTSILTATDAGSDATITIASHVRQYGDGTTLSVTGGTITGLPYSTQHAVYYDDTTTANATPTFLATTTLKNAMPNIAAGRHYCGQVTTPASGGGSVGGGGFNPPGGGGPYP